MTGMDEGHQGNLFLPWFINVKAFSIIKWPPKALVQCP